MKDILIDTNALLSFVTDRNPEQSEKMYDLFNRAGNLDFQICIISNVLNEFIYVLQKIYKTKPVLIVKIIQDMHRMPGVFLHHGFFPESLFSIWPVKFKDYGDACLAAASAELDIPVATFDKKFINQLKNNKFKFKELSFL